jgi:hypothetical protein
MLDNESYSNMRNFILTLYPAMRSVKTLEDVFDIVSQYDGLHWQMYCDLIEVFLLYQQKYTIGQYLDNVNSIVTNHYSNVYFSTDPVVRCVMDVFGKHPTNFFSHDSDAIREISVLSVTFRIMELFFLIGAVQHGMLFVNCNAFVCSYVVSDLPSSSDVIFDSIEFEVDDDKLVDGLSMVVVNTLLMHGEVKVHDVKIPLTGVKCGSDYSLIEVKRAVNVLCSSGVVVEGWTGRDAASVDRIMGIGEYMCSPAIDACDEIAVSLYDEFKMDFYERFGEFFGYACDSVAHTISAVYGYEECVSLLEALDCLTRYEPVHKSRLTFNGFSMSAAMYATLHCISVSGYIVRVPWLVFKAMHTQIPADVGGIEGFFERVPPEQRYKVWLRVQPYILANKFVTTCDELLMLMDPNTDVERDVKFIDIWQGGGLHHASFANLAAACMIGSVANHRFYSVFTLAKYDVEGPIDFNAMSVKDCDRVLSFSMAALLSGTLPRDVVKYVCQWFYRLYIKPYYLVTPVEGFEKVKDFEGGGIFRRPHNKKLKPYDFNLGCVSVVGKRHCAVRQLT